MKRWARRAEERPGDICAAALEVFREKGFAAARVDEIAERAGVSKGTLYLYFRDKEELFEAVVRETVAPNINSLRSATINSDMSFEEVVRSFLSAFGAMAKQFPIGAVIKMVIGESRNFPELAKVWHDEIASQVLEVLAGFIRHAQSRGEVREGDARIHAFTLVGPLLMALLWRETLEPAGGAPIDMEALAKQHAETVLSGLLK